MAELPAVSLPDLRAIGNKALILLGSSSRIDTMDPRDGGDAANILALWDIARRAALAMHPWNFAIARETVARDAAPPAAPFRFTLPTDTLRWLPPARGLAGWFDGHEEGGAVWSAEPGPLPIRYIRDIPDTTRWSPLFVDAMAHTLAIEYCHAKTQAVGLIDRLRQARADLIDEAKRADGQASANQRRQPAIVHSRWAGARFRPHGVSWR